MYKVTAQTGIAGGIYPERDEPVIKKADQWAASVAGKFAPWLRPRAKRFAGIVGAVHAQTRAMEGISDAEVLEISHLLRQRIRNEGYSEELVAQAFALVREVAGRKTGLRHRDVQLIGGAVLLSGAVAEMETGEGKTLTATLPACTLALGGVPVHIITVNDYLARRDADWMGAIYRALGLTVGTIIHGMDHAARRHAYRCDVTYCTNKEVAFDYLRDRLVLWDRPSPLRLQLERLYGEKSRLHRVVMRGLHFAIVDEADSVLVDEARTPLIISSEVEGIFHPAVYQLALATAREFVREKDFRILENDRLVELLVPGKARAGAADWSETGIPFNAPQREELVRQSLVALYLFDRDKHYLVKDGKVQIIDEYTGRLMADRSWEQGLHQLIEVKEGCASTRSKETLARISYQRFFRRYRTLAGMTGTAQEVAEELWSIYRLRVVTVPTNRPLNRHFLPSQIYPRTDQKWKSVVATISAVHRRGRPILVGTRSVEASEHLSLLLDDAGLPHRVLNARQDKEEAEIIARAGERGTITVATNMAGRGTDILLGTGVTDLGGLYVIATEHHEARRIDRQLFGRCGRQGDPGTCEVIVSLEDELVVVYGNTLLKGLVALGLKASAGFLLSPLGALLFRRAQKSAERLHARIRRDLLKFDEQISDSLAFTGRME